MTIYLGADHAGFELKEKIKKFLGYHYEKYKVVDFGALAYDEKDDYPDFVRPVAQAVANDPEQSRGIIIGGSGQGEAMCANRVAGVRAAVYYGPVCHPEALAEGSQAVNDRDSSPPAADQNDMNIIKLSREHNNANVLSLGARFLSDEDALKVVQLWLDTAFSGEERHARRLAKF